MSDPLTFDDSTLPSEFTLPVDAAELILPNLFVGPGVDLLAPGDGIITEHHPTLTPADRRNRMMNPKPASTVAVQRPLAVTGGHQPQLCRTGPPQYRRQRSPRTPSEPRGMSP